MHALMRACYSTSTDLGALRSRLLHELRKLVGFDVAFFAVADPETLLFTAAFADEPLVESGPLFMANEFGAIADVNRFADLALAPDPVTSLDRATAGEWKASPRWREIMDPLGMGDEARAALRVGDTTWGFLCLHRYGAAGFSAEDMRRLRSVTAHMGEALRRRLTLTTEADPDAGTGVQGLVVVRDDRIVALGGAAERWLEEIADRPVVPGDPLPLPLLAVARRLENLEAGALTDLPAAVRLTTAGGVLLTVHATRLRDATGADSIALSLRPAGSAERAPLLLAAHGLTPAQRRVAQLVLRGYTTRQIVVDLRISEHTVQDHLKAVFDKVGVRSRRDLVTAVMQPAGHRQSSP